VTAVLLIIYDRMLARRQEKTMLSPAHQQSRIVHVQQCPRPLNEDALQQDEGKASMLMGKKIYLQWWRVQDETNC
jgi:hypothetical protein